MNVHSAQPSDKKRKFKTFSENNINMGGPGHVRGGMCTKIIESLLTR